MLYDLLHVLAAGSLYGIMGDSLAFCHAVPAVPCTLLEEDHPLHGEAPVPAEGTWAWELDTQDF